MAKKAKKAKKVTGTSDILTKGKSAKLGKDRIEELKEMVSTYSNMYAGINSLSEDELRKCVYLEHNGQARPRMLKLIHGRLNSVRRSNELATLGIAA
jgi:hypothetical protein